MHPSVHKYQKSVLMMDRLRSSCQLCLRAVVFVALRHIYASSKRTSPSYPYHLNTLHQHIL